MDSFVSIWVEDVVCDFGEVFGGVWVGCETIVKNFGDIWVGDTKLFSFFYVVMNYLIEFIGVDIVKVRIYLF